MKFVIFGLTVSSSWGNGHATLWRGLWRALVGRGHQIVFFEQDVPYYAAHRDLTALAGGELIFFRDWDEALPQARRHLGDADVAMVTSFCPQGATASDFVLSSPAAVTVFYDLDTPVTLDNLRRGLAVPYIGPGGLRDFDLVLSYTGGCSLEDLRSLLGARRVAPLYGHVDPDVHRRVSPVENFRCDLSYLGTYSADRQAALAELFIEPARRCPDMRFMIGGAQYPGDFPWAENISFVRHAPPPQHPAFFSSSRFTLNITRRAMAACGYCPSGRLFEAAACCTPVISDWWAGLNQFFAPDQEILVARSSSDVIATLGLSDRERGRIAEAAQQRVLAQHTSDHRARELESLVEAAVSRPRHASQQTPTHALSSHDPLSHD